MTELLDKYTGCLLGGAVGDALGAPVEFLDLEQITSRYGQQGVQDYVEFGDGTGEFTDDTQMTLFTTEGIIGAYLRAREKGIWGAIYQLVYNSYLRWLSTQGEKPVGKDHFTDFSWLMQQRELWKRRAPGNTCLSALAGGIAGTIEKPLNNSKGCGALMRMAPVGLFSYYSSEQAFDSACKFAALTHGHPSGYLSAGCLAMIIAELRQETGLMEAVEKTRAYLKNRDRHEETSSAMENCLALYEKNRNKGPQPFENIEKLGQGWVAEEALAISLYCALLYEKDFKSGVLYAINHSGDSDSTGAITGNLLGVINGEKNIPAHWIHNLKAAEIVRTVATDLHNTLAGVDRKNERISHGYPIG